MANKFYPTIIPFQTVLKFDEPITHMGHYTVTGPIAFSVNLTDAQPWFSAAVTLEANGVNVPTYPGIKLVNGSYSNIAGQRYQMIFYYDGTDVCLSVTAVPSGVDTTPPVITSIHVETATPNQVFFDYNEALDSGSVPVASDYGFLPGAPTSVAISGSRVTVTVATPYAFGDSIQAGYTAGSNPVRDISGNNAANFSGQTVTNNIGASGVTIAGTAWKSRVDTAVAGKLIQTTDPGFAESIVCLINGGLTAAYDFRQFTLANKPAIIASGIHSEPCVEVDANKFMQQTGYAFYTGPLTIFLVIQPKNFANFKYIYSSASTGSRCDFALWDDAATTHKAAMYAGDMPGLKMSSALIVDQSVVICMKRVGGGNDKIFKNQTLEVTGDAGSHNTYQGGALGLNGGTTDTPKVWIKEVAIFEGAMSDADILTLNQEFQTKNGIS
jgi:hypothetical protein